MSIIRKFEEEWYCKYRDTWEILLKQTFWFIDNEICFFFSERKGRFHSSSLILPNPNFLFLDFSLLFLCFNCVTKLYQIHLKLRTTVSCGLSD
jgi:hypothetical protein